MTKKKLLIIDGDILLFKAITSTVKQICINDIRDCPLGGALGEYIHNNYLTSLDGDDIKVVWNDFTDVVTAMEFSLKSWFTELGTDEYIMTLSDKENFRKQVLPDYKAHRGEVKPLCFNEARKYLTTKHAAVIMPRLEADDVQGILATSPEHSSKECVIVSVDKDMEQIPTTVFNVGKKSGDGRLRTYTAKEGLYKHWIQALEGDKTDNYDGCVGIGPVKAARVVDVNMTEEEGWKAVVKEFEKAEHTKEYMMQQIRVSKILQYEDYDQETGEIRLFTLPEGL